MLKQAARSMWGRLVAARVLNAAQARGELPNPRDEPRVYAAGPDPDRILVVGGPPVCGMGVASHNLGIGGHLARRLSDLTGRGTDVELVGELMMSPEACRTSLAAMDLDGYDALVIVLGAMEAVTLRSSVRWGRSIRAMLAYVGSDRRPDGRPSGRPGLSVFVAAIPPFPGAMKVWPVISRSIDAHIVALNAETLAACAEADVSFIPFEPSNLRNISNYGDVGTYAEWAQSIAASMRGPLNAAAAKILLPTRVQVSESDRQDALDSLEVVDTPSDPVIDEIVQTARDLFGAAMASVTFVDHDRVWIKSILGYPASDSPRGDSFCSVTITGNKILVVEDASLDRRFSTLPGVVGGIRFYAGYPLVAPNGQRVGALCVADVMPRTFSNADASLLRSLALRVQRVLWEPAAAAN